MLLIANPIYDSVFKFMMLDEKAAKCLLSAVLDREIELLELLEVLPQEHIISSSEHSGLSVVRFDYRATIREEDGSVKKVLLELQKIKKLVDINRFRRYLGENYSIRDRLNGEELSLPITTIYLLGFELEVRRPVIRIGRQYIDAVTKESVDGTDAFIEALTHDAYFVQIPLLPEKQKTRVERVLSVFLQSWKMQPKEGEDEQQTRMLLSLPNDLRNEENAPLVDRLSLAIADPVLKRQTLDEESFDEILRRELGQEFEKGMEEGIQQGIQQGIQRGVEQGIQAALLKTVANLKAIGASLEMIQSVTGLSESELEQFKG